MVVGLGPADAGLVTAATLDAVAAHPPEARWARTDRHPSIAVLGDHGSFDDVYESADRIGDVYPTIVERLVVLAGQFGSVLYAVPGSPLVAERTVELLRLDPRVELVVLPALSFLDLAWDRLGVDPLAVSVRVVDGHRFAAEAAGERGPLLVAQCDSVDVLSEVKLAVEDEPPSEVVVLARLGLPDERVDRVAWDDLDRIVDADHLTSLWIPELSAPVGAEIAELVEVVRALRERCPWDSTQTHASLAPYAVEEAYEVVDAIERFDPESGAGVDDLEEELGDLLFQVLLHATIAAEEGWFGLADVARVVREKLVRRHPHVFGPDADATIDVAAVEAAWDRLKAEEKGRSGPFEGIPASFPPRLAVAKVLRRARTAGVEVDFAGALAALDAAEEAVRAEVRRVVGGDAG